MIRFSKLWGAVLALAAGVSAGLYSLDTARAAEGQWQVRRALSPDQEQEWTEAGYLPGWTVTFNDSGDGFRIDGDGEGKFRGAVLVGRSIEIPRPAPPGLSVRLKFKTFCEMDDPPRGGYPCLALFTQEGWQRFEESPSPTVKFDTRSEDWQPICFAAMSSQGEDVVEWRQWESDELARRLRDYAGESLIVAVAWTAHHFHAEEWAEFGDFEIVAKTKDDLRREFFQSFDLSRPELSAVADAVSKSDWGRAGAALAGYFRERSTVPPPPLPAAGSTAAADKVIDHVFTLVGCPPHRLGPKIEWNEDPFDYDQWAISLNRHDHWRTLGGAYAGTKGERYAQEFAAQLRSWIAAMPVQIGKHYVEGPYSEAGRSPLSLDAGIRMAQTWFPAFYYFRSSPSFSDDDLVAMLGSFRRHAIYLMDPRHFRSGSNWGAMESAGLLSIGCNLPEFKQAKTWRETAIERLYQELDQQVYPDGAQKELTPGYHGVTLGNVLSAVEVARRCEVELPEDFIAKLERMFDYYVRIAMPDRTTPPVNDSGTGSVKRHLSKGLGYFPDRQDFRHVITDGAEGVAPGYTSTILPYAGWHMMRSGWETDACYLFLDGGPFGSGHQHEDKLSIIVHAFGKMVVPEAGRYSYDDSPWRRYVLSTRAHNTVMVDGLDQRHRAVRDSFESKEPVDTTWLTNDVLDFAQAEYSLGFGLAENVRVVHRRSVLFIKPRLWLVVDRLHPEDEAAHQYESLFHLNAADATVNESSGAVVSVNPTGPNVALIPVCRHGWQVKIIQGQEEPSVQGWLPTARHNELRPVPTAVYSRRQTGDATMACVIAPLREAEAAPVVKPIGTSEVAVASGFAFRVTLPDETEYVVLWNDRPGTQLLAEEFRTSARLAVFTGDDRLAGEVP